MGALRLWCRRIRIHVVDLATLIYKSIQYPYIEFEYINI
jgi:hypothetical protein